MWTPFVFSISNIFFFTYIMYTAVFCIFRCSKCHQKWFSFTTSLSFYKNTQNMSDIKRRSKDIVSCFVVLYFCYLCNEINLFSIDRLIVSHCTNVIQIINKLWWYTHKNHHILARCNMDTNWRSNTIFNWLNFGKLEQFIKEVCKQPLFFKMKLRFTFMVKSNT